MPVAAIARDPSKHIHFAPLLPSVVERFGEHIHETHQTTAAQAIDRLDSDQHTQIITHSAPCKIRNLS